MLGDIHVVAFSIHFHEHTHYENKICLYFSISVGSVLRMYFEKWCMTGPEVIILFSCSTQLSAKFILLINVKMPTIVGILTFISRINTTSEKLLPLSVF